VGSTGSALRLYGVWEKFPKVYTIMGKELINAIKGCTYRILFNVNGPLLHIATN